MYKPVTVILLLNLELLFSLFAFFLLSSRRKYIVFRFKKFTSASRSLNLCSVIVRVSPPQIRGKSSFSFVILILNRFNWTVFQSIILKPKVAWIELCGAMSDLVE
jgi:hypothetical protein